MGIINIIIVLSAAIIAGAQTLLLFFEKKAICFNSGCEIVENLTKVPAEVFNIAGCLYFLSITYFLIKARKPKSYSKFWEKLAGLFLLGGAAAEGVLFSFQHFVIEIYCSYCLVIFGFVLIANLLFSWQQFLKSFSAFAAVLVAFSVLNFNVDSGEKYNIDLGTYGIKQGMNIDEDRYFFFSDTCPHCEEVIASIDEDNMCSINFNPIVNLDAPPLPGMALKESYNNHGNVELLSSLGILEIPVLITKNVSGGEIFKGKKAIRKYFQENCYGDKVVVKDDAPEEEIGESQVASDDGFDFLVPTDDGNCTIESTDVDCN